MDSGDSARTHDLHLALKDGQEVESAEERITLRRRAIGELIVTSGRIVACDPKWLEQAEPPFLTPIAPGHYPVNLSIAHFPDGNQRVAYATVQVQECAPVRWEIARREGDAVGAAHASAYSVDSGKGCFMDAALLYLLIERSAADADDETFYERMNIGAGYEDAIDEAMERTRVPTWGWANISPEPGSIANMVVFSSGLGDGAYATYAGHDADNGLVCFTTDFALLRVRRGA